MREKSHSEGTISPMETWAIEMAQHSLFLSCICHMLLVISDTTSQQSNTSSISHTQSAQNTPKQVHFNNMDIKHKVQVAVNNY